MSKGEFVRSAIEAALAARIAVADPVAELAAMNAPTSDIGQMLDDVESRYA